MPTCETTRVHQRSSPPTQSTQACYTRAPARRQLTCSAQAASAPSEGAAAQERFLMRACRPSSAASAHPAASVPEAAPRLILGRSAVCLAVEMLQPAPADVYPAPTSLRRSRDEKVKIWLASPHSVSEQDGYLIGHEDSRPSGSPFTPLLPTPLTAPPVGCVGGVRDDEVTTR